MKLRDYMRLSWDQLNRRKVVTALCALGISIGSAAIIVALAVGESAAYYTDKEMKSFLKTDEITIRNEENNQGQAAGGDSQGSAGASSTAASPNAITNQKLDLIRGLPHVKAVASFQRMGHYYFTLDDGKTGNFELIATDLDTLVKFGNEFQQGGPSDVENTIIISPGAAMGLFDEQGEKNRRKQMQQNPNDQEMWKAMRELEKIPTPLYQKQISVMQEHPANTAKQQTQIPVRVTGVLKKPDGMSSDRVMYYKQAYISHALAKKIREASQASGQTPDGKPVSMQESYSEVLVKVDQTSNLEAVEKQIQKLRLNTQNNLHQEERMEGQFVIMRIVFLGIGLFILFIASISIVVAMTMSTYQRRRQIGIMKVLGANLAQIRNMFIVESALLGLLGGLLGILLSYWVVWGINAILFMTGQIQPGENNQILFISSWILPTGMFFAIMTGVLSGIYPAVKASRTDALTAIKRE
ncbi:ABC transporter permease [Paenibacillus sp. FJAT-26967]|uniref:ABC transporter permease n=1 Tax=Paenibacillus sp. FJAT-26967 TaxID=1729690 RepID=UPI0008396FBB|nr:ABC transporter permease [Paenibacillus sp. FJAT-26967]